MQRMPLVISTSRRASSKLSFTPLDKHNTPFYHKMTTNNSDTHH